MACQSCQRYQQMQLEKRRLIGQQRRQRSADDCARSDQGYCRMLQQMDFMTLQRQPAGNALACWMSTKKTPPLRTG